MTTEELQALERTVETICRIQHDYTLAVRFEEEAFFKRMCAMRVVRMASDLHRDRLAVEAHRSTGMPFPRIVVDLAEQLEQIGKPDVLGIVEAATAAKVMSDAAAIVGCVLQRPAAVPEQVQIPASTSGPDNPRPCYINTNKNWKELDRIYSELVSGGFIDGSAPDALANFHDAFDKDATKQGRISWIGESSKHKDGACFRQIIDFIFLMQGAYSSEKELFRIISAIFGESPKRTIITSAITSARNGKPVSERNADLRKIIAGQ